MHCNAHGARQGLVYRLSVFFPVLPFRLPKDNATSYVMAWCALVLVCCIGWLLRWYLLLLLQQLLVLPTAGEAASVVLMGDRLSQVVDCISLGTATLNKIKQNLAWALIYNVIGIPLAAGALLPSMGLALNPSAAGGMMAFSSVAVVSNSLLLRSQYGAAASARHQHVGSSSSNVLSGAAGRV